MHGATRIWVAPIRSKNNWKQYDVFVIHFKGFIHTTIDNSGITLALLLFVAYSSLKSTLFPPDYSHYYSLSQLCGLSRDISWYMQGSSDVVHTRFPTVTNNSVGISRVLLIDLEGTLITAPLIRPSVPSSDLSILANFQSPCTCLSLCTISMSPCFNSGCGLFFIFWQWQSLSCRRYSLLHCLQKCYKVIARRCALLLNDFFDALFQSSSSKHAWAVSGKFKTLRRVKQVQRCQGLLQVFSWHIGKWLKPSPPL